MKRKSVIFYLVSFFIITNIIPVKASDAEVSALIEQLNASLSAHSFTIGRSGGLSSEEWQSSYRFSIQDGYMIINFTERLSLYMEDELLNKSAETGTYRMSLAALDNQRPYYTPDYEWANIYCKDGEKCIERQHIGNFIKGEKITDTQGSKLYKNIDLYIPPELAEETANTIKSLISLSVGQP